MHLQPALSNDIIRLEPLKATDFEMLYQIASDPLIWEQHPNPDRYKREVFEVYFKGALESGGAFVIFNSNTNKPIGSTRFYDYNLEESKVYIGYTFFARDHWGGKFNHATKHLMLDYAFQFVHKVYFHIGANNVRSQIAIGRLGAKKVREIEVKYYGEVTKLNYEYVIERMI